MLCVGLQGLALITRSSPKHREVKWPAKQLRINKQTIGTKIITSGLPNLVTYLPGIDHVTEEFRKIRKGLRGIQARARDQLGIGAHMRQLSLAPRNSMLRKPEL